MKNLLWRLDRSLIAKADAARDAQAWPAAAQLYRKILDRRPARTGVWVQYGHSLNALERPAEALMAFEEADRLSPDNADTLFHMANTLAALGQTEHARELFVRAAALSPDRSDFKKAALAALPKDSAIPDRLEYVILGTTGTCNASCVHCPTGKVETAHVPRTPMPMPLFRKIIDEIADSGLVVTGQIAFGLFGDALADPFVVERARYLRSRLPDATLSINSNGAAYDPNKHAVLNEYASVFGLHCESLVPETYNYLMQPLRAERVHVKFPMIFRDFPGKVYVAVPLSKLNIDERHSMGTYFRGLGARAVEFAPIINRCAEDDTLFDSLAFKPHKIACKPEIFYNLIVDCDGTVLACCNDFKRIEPVGNLAVDTLEDTLAHQLRMEMHRKLRQGEHDRLATCARCRADVDASIPEMTSA